MTGGTKNFFSFLRTKKAAGVFCLILILGVLLPLHPAYAFLGIGTWLEKLPFRFISVIFSLLVWLTTYLAAFAGMLLQWVTSDSFTNLPYTRPGLPTDSPPGNPVIQVGLSLTQGFANVFIVLALVYIAIVTILRLEGYNTQKLLVKLIFIALIVNFAPVICGLIVDAANIVMHFFVGGMTGETFVDSARHTMETIKSTVNTDTFDFEKEAGALLALALMIAVNIGLFLALLIFSVLFIARYVAIWILVILSPLAFVSTILPKTKSMLWDKWWDQFIQWSIIGITAGFFLYLANYLTSQTGFIIKNSPASSEPGIQLGTIILPLIVPLAFLWFGLFYALTTSAMGSGAIVNFANKGRKWAQTKGKQGAKWGGKWAKTATADKIAASKTYQKVTQGMAKFGGAKLSTEGKGFAGRWTSRAVNAATWVARAPVSKIGSAGMKYATSQTKTGEDEVAKKFNNDGDKIAANYNTIKAGDWKSKRDHALALAKSGKLDKLSPENLKEATEIIAKYNPDRIKDLTAKMPELNRGIYDKDKDGNPLTDKNLERQVLNASIKGGVDVDTQGNMAANKKDGKYEDKDVQKMSEVYASEIAAGTKKEADLIRLAAMKKAVDKMKDADIENLSNEAIDSADFQEIAAYCKSPRFLIEIAAQKGVKVAEGIWDKVKDKTAEEMMKINPDLVAAGATNDSFRTTFGSFKSTTTGKLIEGREELKEFRRSYRPAPPSPQAPPPKSMAAQEKEFEERQKEKPREGGMVEMIRKNLEDKQKKRLKKS